MPNHVYHTISISIKDITKEKQEILNNIEKAGGICRYYKPMPQELDGSTSPARIGDGENDTITEERSAELKHKYGYDNWYDWCCNNWGTKWGCFDFEIEDAQLTFTTAWSPMQYTIIELMSQDFPNMLWNYEEEQGWGAEISIEEGEFVDVVQYDTPNWVKEEEIDCGGKNSITLAKLEKEHPSFEDGIGWYVEYSHEFAGKTLKEAKEYLSDNVTGGDSDIMGGLDENGDLI